MRNNRRINDERNVTAIKITLQALLKIIYLPLRANRTELDSNIVDACIVCIAIDFLKTNGEHDRPFASNG